MQYAELLKSRTIVGKRVSSLEGLKEPFRSAVKWLIARLAYHDVHVVLFETHRGIELQEEYYKIGTSKAKFGQSAHNWGYAADFVLDTKKVKTRTRMHKGKPYPDPWDNTTPEALMTWKKFGKIAKECGLTWGGEWKFVDLPHVELPWWTGLLNGQPPEE